MKKNTAKKRTAPITKKTGVQQSNDEHIDQDFPGFPNSPAQENVISPKTHAEHVAANAEDVEIIPQPPQLRRQTLKKSFAALKSLYQQKCATDIYDYMFD